MDDHVQNRSYPMCRACHAHVFVDKSGCKRNINQRSNTCSGIQKNKIEIYRRAYTAQWPIQQTSMFQLFKM